MSDCVNTLEHTLQNFDCKLNTILYQLEHKFSKMDNNLDDSQCEPIDMNCVQIVTTFKEIQNDLQQIKEQYKQIEELKDKTNADIRDKCRDIEEYVKQLALKFDIN